MIKCKDNGEYITFTSPHTTASLRLVNGVAELDIYTFHPKQGRGTIMLRHIIAYCHTREDIRVITGRLVPNGIPMVKLGLWYQKHNFEIYDVNGVNVLYMKTTTKIAPSSDDICNSYSYCCPKLPPRHL